ncbi:hypothetical protein SLS53_003443 [Cytospora paraplurivora]|uniref:Rhodopsin domain-containing protein n=1 Tax=Cytospora paraplurivora TaxID=2898453 RepID=A0AAN9YH28_9PEZI
MSSATAVDLTESKQAGLRALYIAMAIVPTVIVLIRAWSRALLPVSPTSIISTKFWWDDWTAFAAAAINVAVCGLGLKLIDLGLGLHLQALPPENIEKFLKLLWIVYYIFDTGTAVGKASALFFYARIFSASHSKFKYALWLVHALNVAWLLTILLCVTFMCSPIRKAWDTTLPGTCLNTGILWTGSGSEIAISVISVSIPSVFYLAQQVHRKGFWSIVPTRAKLSAQGHTGTHDQLRDEEDDRLVARAHNYPYLSQTKATAEFSGANERSESIAHSGIIVMHNIEVV